ncbi:hypothetical protein P5V15_006215 [Pogonomyrmex californicus]
MKHPICMSMCMSSMIVLIARELSLIGQTEGPENSRRSKCGLGIARVVTPDCTFSVLVNEPIKRTRPSGCREYQVRPPATQ